MRSSGGSNSGLLADQLSILQNELGKDGFLSPGDYDLLIEKARTIQSMPGLSASQKSEYNVKISAFEKQKSVGVLSKEGDIGFMNRSVESERAEDVMAVGNSPVDFLFYRKLSTEAKINDLNEMISIKQQAGDDVSEYMNEYNATMNQYRNQLEAVSAMANFDGTNPIQGHVAYVTTNNNGEIVDVDYAKYGSKSGYAETNGTIDGFQVYGKTNYKRDGNNYFILGDTEFSAVDMIMPDPENPSSMKPNKLVANSKSAGGRLIGESGYVNLQGQSLQVQGYIPTNSWAKGVDGSVYKRREDGGYSKYININRSMPNMPDQDRMITLPDYYEKAIMSKSDDTIDMSAPIAPDEGLNQAPLGPQLQERVPEAAPQALPQTQSLGDMSVIQRNVPTTPEPGVPTLKKTPKKPDEESPVAAGNVIQKTVRSGVDYLKRIFS